MIFEELIGLGIIVGMAVVIVACAKVIDWVECKINMFGED